MKNFLKTTTAVFFLFALSSCTCTGAKTADVAYTESKHQEQVQVYQRSLVLGELIAGQKLPKCKIKNTQAIQQLAVLQADLQFAVDEVVAHINQSNGSNVGQSWAASCEADCSCGFYARVINALSSDKVDSAAKAHIQKSSDNFSTQQRRACASRLQNLCGS